MTKSKAAFLAVVCIFWFSAQVQDGLCQSLSEKVQNNSSSVKYRTVQANGNGKSTSGIAADTDKYVIGPEDVLDIFVWKEESLSKTVPVRIDGKISLPLLDDIQAAGLTPLQLKDDITSKLKKFVDHPTVTVTVREANSYRVFVSGEVKQPGVIHNRSEMTLVKLIVMAGGFTEWANKRKILILRKDNNGKEKRITANYNKIIDGDEPDIVIKPGDTLIIP